MSNKHTPRGTQQLHSSDPVVALKLSLLPLSGIRQGKIHVTGPIKARLWFGPEYLNILWTNLDGTQHGRWLRRVPAGKGRWWVSCPLCGRRTWLLYIIGDRIACTRCTRLAQKQQKWGYRQPKEDTSWLAWLERRAGAVLTGRGRPRKGGGHTGQKP